MAESDKASNVKDVAEAVAELVKAVPVYKDAVQPAALQLGQVLAAPLAVVSAALRPVRLVVNTWNLAFDRLEEKVGALLAGKTVVEPKPNVAGPLLLAYPFVADEPPLREMFERLLAAAMNADTSDAVHPSFVEIIRQLTSDEARLIEQIAEHPPSDRDFPCGRVDRLLANGTTYNVLGVVVSLDLTLLTVPRRLGQYLDNLDRLGLIDVQYLITLAGLDDVYVAFEREPFVEAMRASVQSDESVRVTRGAGQVTDFGHAFFRACVEKSAPA